MLTSRNNFSEQTLICPPPLLPAGSSLVYYRYLLAIEGNKVPQPATGRPPDDDGSSFHSFRCATKRADCLDEYLQHRGETRTRARDQLDINRGEVITEEEETAGATAIEIKIYETKRDTERVPCRVCNEGKQHTLPLVVQRRLRERRRRRRMR